MQLHHRTGTGPSFPWVPPGQVVQQALTTEEDSPLPDAKCRDTKGWLHLTSMKPIRGLRITTLLLMDL